MLPIHTILVPTDFSAFAGFAFRLACSLARDFGARVVVLHVSAPPQVGSFGGMPVIPDPAEAALKDLDVRLHQYQAPEADVHVEHRVIEGFAAPEILRVAGEVNCGLIIMGTHGRTGLSRLLMGSVAEQIVRKAQCPVLTVKMPVAKADEAPAASACEAVPVT